MSETTTYLPEEIRIIVVRSNKYLRFTPKRMVQQMRCFFNFLSRTFISMDRLEYNFFLARVVSESV